MHAGPWLLPRPSEHRRADRVESDVAQARQHAAMGQVQRNTGKLEAGETHGQPADRNGQRPAWRRDRRRSIGTWRSLVWGNAKFRHKCSLTLRLQRCPSLSLHAASSHPAIPGSPPAAAPVRRESAERCFPQRSAAPRPGTPWRQVCRLSRIPSNLMVDASGSVGLLPCRNAARKPRAYRRAR